MNEVGQLLLIRSLAMLGPGQRHFHLAHILTPESGDADIHEADLVLIDGHGDIAHVPPD